MDKLVKKIVCKKTDKEFLDIENKSGAITNHIKEIYKEIEIPSTYKRRKYKSENGVHWHMQFFKEKTETVNKKRCKYCNWETSDIDNKSGAYTNHLKKEHGIDIDQYVNEFPDEKTLFNTHFNKKEKREKVLNSEESYVKCEICGEKMSYITNTHLKKHGITNEEYKLKFPNAKTSSDAFLNKTTKILKESVKSIKKSFVSKPEKSLRDFISNELNIKTSNNDRRLLSGIEIDIIDHNSKIGIEFNGLKYHTEIFGKKDKNFHLNKTELMNKFGYKLIHIFEDEWETKNKLVLNKIRHIFNKNINSKIIHTRKCKVIDISYKEKSEFLNNNHIQGNDGYNTISLGLLFDNEIVSIMTFDNKRSMSKLKNDNNSYELKRFCVKNEYRVPGAANKILKTFIKKYKPKEIISFADKRWTISENNLYTKLGFNKVKELRPDYTYFNNKLHRSKRYHKFGFGKKSIKKKFPDIYDENKTEWELMQLAGFDRIWDCGKIKYQLSL